MGENSRNRLKIDKLFHRLQLFSCLFSGTIDRYSKKTVLILFNFMKYRPCVPSGFHGNGVLQKVQFFALDSLPFAAICTIMIKALLIN